MRRRKQVRLQVEQMDQKALLSAFIPVLTHNTLSQVIHQIDQAASTFAKTHNENTFATTIGNISFRIPYGHNQLNPTWQGDIAKYNPTVAGSGLAMINQIKSDLGSYIRSGVSSGAFRFH